MEASLFRFSRARGRERVNSKFSACQIFESKQCGSRKYRTEFKGTMKSRSFNIQTIFFVLTELTTDEGQRLLGNKKDTQPQDEKKKEEQEKSKG